MAPVPPVSPSAGAGGLLLIPPQAPARKWVDAMFALACPLEKHRRISL